MDSYLVQCVMFYNTDCALSYNTSTKIKYNKSIPRIYFKNILHINSFILKVLKDVLKLIYVKFQG
jgi:hypothetical protein